MDDIVTRLRRWDLETFGRVHAWEAANEIEQLRATLNMGVQLCKSGGHGKGKQCPTCHFMRAALVALGRNGEDGNDEACAVTS